MSEWLKEHAWKSNWRPSMACCGFRLPLRSQPLRSARVTSVDHRNFVVKLAESIELRHGYVTVFGTLKEHSFGRPFDPSWRLKEHVFTSQEHARCSSRHNYVTVARALKAHALRTCTGITTAIESQGGMFLPLVKRSLTCPLLHSARAPAHQRTGCRHL